MEPDLLAELGTCQHACAESPPINAGKPQHLNPAKLPGHPQEDSRDSTRTRQLTQTSLLVVTTRPALQSSRCEGQQDRIDQEEFRTSKALSRVSAAIPLGDDSPQDQSHHPSAAIAPSAD